MHSQSQVVDLLEREELRPGDRLDVIIDDEDKSILLFAILLLLAAGLFVYFKKEQKREERIAEGARILEGLTASENAEELEREIEAEYGIQIEFIREEDDDAAWSNAAAILMTNGYTDDEPDYSDVLNESNPRYKPNPDYKA